MVNNTREKRLYLVFNQNIIKDLFSFMVKFKLKAEMTCKEILLIISSMPVFNLKDISLID